MARSSVLNAAVHIRKTTMASAKSDARSSPVTAHRLVLWARFTFGPSLPALVAVYVPLLLVLALARWVFLAHASDVIEPLTFDLAANFSHSLFTMLHVTGWTLALIVTLSGTRRATRDGHTPPRVLLAGATLLSTLFLLDDLFQLHKPVVPDWAGVPSAAVLTAYAAPWPSGCGPAVARSRNTDVRILAVTLVFFAAWFACKASARSAAANVHGDQLEIVRRCGLDAATRSAPAGTPTRRRGSRPDSLARTAIPCSLPPVDARVPRPSRGLAAVGTGHERPSNRADPAAWTRGSSVARHPGIVTAKVRGANIPEPPKGVEPMTDSPSVKSTSPHRSRRKRAQAFFGACLLAVATVGTVVVAGGSSASAAETVNLFDSSARPD